MNENGIEPQDRQDQNPDLAPDGKTLKRKAAIVAAVVLVVAGLGLGGAWVSVPARTW